MTKPTAKQKERAAILLQEEDFRALMANASGRRFVWRLLNLANVFGASFAVDASATAFNEGQRSVGIGLMLEAQRLTPVLYAAMVQEAIDGLPPAEPEPPEEPEG